MLSLLVFMPLVAAGALAVLPRVPDAAARWAWVAVAGAELVLVVAMALAYRTPAPGGLAFEQRVRWIPAVGTSYHVGLDGISLPLAALTCVVFLACAVYALREAHRPRAQAALFLFLQTACLGVFAAQDLVLFFVFFDLSIVGMYFSIAGWGHGDRARSALRFFLYTFLGSLALLVAFIGLYLASAPHTFDIVELAANPPLQGSPTTGVLVLVAALVGLGIKTPVAPVHTWLPPAHTDAPTIGSVVLAGVMLKLGTYGLVRVVMPLLPDAWRAAAWVVVTLGIVSALYGALVALAQSDFKRMVAYTSVNHMGYVVLALGAAGLAGGSAASAASGAPAGGAGSALGAAAASSQQLAVMGAVTQMVSHGLITAALFLLAGVLGDRTGSYAMGPGSTVSGLGRLAPRWAALLAVASFASLGLPAFSGFVAELQVFAGSIATAPVTAVALLGILITAALFLRALQHLLTGPARAPRGGFADLRAAEAVPVVVLLVLATAIGVAPQPLLDVIAPTSAWITSVVTPSATDAVAASVAAPAGS